MSGMTSLYSQLVKLEILKDRQQESRVVKQWCSFLLLPMPRRAENLVVLAARREGSPEQFVAPLTAKESSR